MDEQAGQDFWSGVEPGHATALVGQGGRLPPSPRGWCVVRVRCDGSQRPLAVIEEARARAARLIGEERAPVERATRLARGIRRHLLGELVGPEIPERSPGLARDLDRLAEAATGPTAFLFEAVDAADPASLEQLVALVRRPDRVRPALVFGMREAGGAAAPLLAAVREVEGEAHVVEGARTAPAPRPDLGGLGFELRQVLRAAAVIGEPFEIELVGQLLELSPRVVLERLQAAVDAGVPVEDLGGGRMRLDEAWTAALTASLLPSLAAAWHEQLAGLLAPAEEARLDPASQDIHLASEPEAEAEPLVQERVAPPAPEPLPDPEPDPFSALAAEPAEPSPAPVPLPAPVAQELDPEPEGDPFSALAAPAPAARPAPGPRAAPAAQHPAEPPAWGALLPDDEAPADAASWVIPTPRAPPPVELAPPPSAPRPDPVRAPRPDPVRAARPDPARSARHLAAVGQAEDAARRYLQAARRAVAHGALPAAEAEVRRALALLEGLPDTPARRAIRASAHAELARVRWEGSGGAGWTLGAAGREADDAFRLVEQATDPAGVAARAEIRAIRAGIAVDVGDPAALERALGDLVAASRERSALGDARGAAGLLNDQAAVWVRIGDPVRAAHLLSESRAVFERGERPEDRRELAETLHLLARLPLTVSARPGLEARAIEVALAQADEAAELAEALGDGRLLAAVLETAARLEMRRGGLGRARERLGRALDIQLAAGDALGLARSTGTLAEALALGGRFEEALRVLADSIQMNASKGSRSGLSWNRKTLEALLHAAPAEAAPALRPLAEAVAGQLAAAEARMGSLGGAR